MRNISATANFRFAAALAVALLLGAAHTTLSAQPSVSVSDAVRVKLLESGRARVIVQLNLPGAYRSEGEMFVGALGQQRREIFAKQRQLLSRLRGSHRLLHQFRSVPFVALEVDAAALDDLEASGLDVARIVEDRVLRPSLTRSVRFVEGTIAQWFGLDGTGTAIAIVDSGVDKSHSFLAGRVVEEACYAGGEGGSPGDCPNGSATMIGPGAGVPCTFTGLACGHGTHVAGIAAGSASSFSGVAPGADLIAIQVFHSSVDCIPFLEEIPCARAFGSDIAAGLERVYDLRDQYNIAAVNLSLGGGSFPGACDTEDPQLTAVIDNLRSAGIATIAASGNGYDPSAMSFPACVSSAVSVASSTFGNQVSDFSNVSPELDLFAPGDGILSSFPGETFISLLGTSMSTPHVSGAFAVLRQADPTANVDMLLSQLQTSGLPVTDNRSGVPITRPRIRIGTALGLEYPIPVLNSISPDTARAWGPGFTLTVTGIDIVPDSVVQLDGVDLATTYVDSTTLTATVSTTDLFTGATSADVTVFTPVPGGGTSNPVALGLLQPSLVTNATSVMPGDPISVTLTDGPGFTFDYINVALVGSDEASLVDWTYVNGATTMTWSTNAPATPGDYEFRFYPNNGYVRAATSATFTVQALPPATLTVDTTTAAPGDQVTVTMTGGPGGQNDWLALAPVGSPNTTYVAYNYVSAGATTATWTVTMPSTEGSYEFRLFLNNGYTLSAASASVTVQAATGGPTLTVDTTTAAPGDQVTVTLTNGPGGPQDWLALAAVGSPNTTYLVYNYLSAGATTATWTVTMPSTEGSYEFRLFLNNGYTLAATSPPVTVQSAVAQSRVGSDAFGSRVVYNAVLPHRGVPQRKPSPWNDDRTTISAYGSPRCSLSGVPNRVAENNLCASTA
ncbi:MAG: S8 family serine peptidase [Gammaproteobacteria bacterium]|nr:S8 family serine peptidase [Gammaproteobacteria bacterium]